MINFNDDVLISVKRKGSTDNPFIFVSESKIITNGFTVLRETVDSFNGITVTGGERVWIETKNRNETLTENMFYCDYRNGYLYFNPSNDNLVIQAEYMGTGGLFISSSRIVHSQDLNGNLSKTLDDMVDEVNQTIDNANGKIAETVVAIQDTLTARQDTINATNLAITAYNNANFIWKPFIESYPDISTVYPNPQAGWTTQARDTGVRYRWDGSSWVAYEKIVVVQGSNIVISNTQISDTNAIWIDTST